MNYRIGDDARGSDVLAKGLPAFEWTISAFMRRPPISTNMPSRFDRPIAATTAWSPNQGRETWDVTFYAGARLWQGAEFWINPEIDQGFGLSSTLGVAGFPSGEAYKVGAVGSLRAAAAGVRAADD